MSFCFYSKWETHNRSYSKNEVMELERDYEAHYRFKSIHLQFISHNLTDQNDNSGRLL